MTTSPRHAPSCEPQGGFTMRQVRLVLVLGLLAVMAACSREAPLRLATNGKALAGTVLERLDAPPYSFLRLDLGEREAWVAVPISTFHGGDRVNLTNGVTLRNYGAPTIGKRFDEVVFGIVSR